MKLEALTRNYDASDVLGSDSDSSSGDDNDNAGDSEQMEGAY